MNGDVAKAIDQFHTWDVLTDKFVRYLGEYRKDLIEENTLESLAAVKYFDKFYSYYWGTSRNDAYFGNKE